MSSRCAFAPAVLPAYLALAAAVAGIAWSAIFVRWAAVPGTVSAFYRVTIAATVLIPWSLASRRTNRRRARSGSRRAMWTAVAGGVFFALDLALWNTAVMETQAAVASVLGNNTPIFVGLMSWLLVGRRPRASFWIGLALAATGCMLMATGCMLIMSVNLEAGIDAPGSLRGDLLALGGSLFFAAYLFATERVRRSMDTLTFSTPAITGSVAALLVIALAFRFPLLGHPPRTWAALVGVGLVTQLGAYYALVYALGHLPATITSVGLLAQVPCTAILAWLLLGDPLAPVQIAGEAVVLAGIYVVNRGERTG